MLVKSKVSGEAMFRFQPIVDVNRIKVQGYEVLSGINGAMESYYAGLDDKVILAQFKEQMEFCSEMNPRYDYFLNLNVSNLMRADVVEWIITHSGPNICVEIQDPGCLSQYSHRERESLLLSICRLREYGIRVWIDDADEQVLELFRHFSLDGIKIDKSQLWNNNFAVLQQLVNRSRLLAEKVLIEGVETEYLLKCSCKLRIDLCQGFYWPEMRLTKSDRRLVA